MVSNVIIYINNESRLIDIIKSDMKQTLEEAAKQELISSYAVVGDRGGFTELLYNYNAMLNMFRKGAEWKAKQSPWISVQETPPMDIPLLLRYGNGGMYDLEVAEYSGIHYYNIQGQILDAEITHWMPIPKFNE